MDYLRSCYSTRFRPLAGSEQEGTIAWFRAAPGARAWRGTHAWGSNVWEDQTGEQKQGVGEVGFVRNWKGCTNPGLAGDHFDGTLAWFTDGVPVGQALINPSPCNGSERHVQADLELEADVRRLINPNGVQADLLFEGTAPGQRSTFHVNGDLLFEGTVKGIAPSKFINGDLLFFGTAPGFRMPLAAAATTDEGFIVDTSFQTLTFGAVEYDSSTFFDLGARPTKVIVPEDGLYVFGYRGEWVGVDGIAGDCRYLISALVNGGPPTFDDTEVIPSFATQPAADHGNAFEAELSANDTITFGCEAFDIGTSTVSFFGRFWIEFRGPL